MDVRNYRVAICGRGAGAIGRGAGASHLNNLDPRGGTLRRPSVLSF